MPASHLNRILDPLADKFALADLPKVAPWVYEEIAVIGIKQIDHAVAELGENPREPQLMRTWVAAIDRQHSALWQALAQG
jgi:hypothetical protein